MLNKVVIMGRITHDLELKTTNGQGVSVLGFRIAVDRNYKENGEYPTDFFNVVAWRKTAEFISKFFAKGQMIVVDGTLQTRKYTDKNNAMREITEIVVDSAFFGESKKSDNPTATPSNFPAPQNNGQYQRNNQATIPNSVVVPSDGEFGDFPDDFSPFNS